MTGSTPTQGPLPRLDDLGELVGGETPSSRTFLRGLAIGALVGAAIAGSRAWSQRRAAIDAADAADAAGSAPRVRPRRTTVPDGGHREG